MEQGTRSCTVENPFYVFQKIKNTPSYWSQRKNELIYKLENKGPFHFFFTLSCADARWDENFSTQLRDLNLTISCEKDVDTDEMKTFVTIQNKTVTLTDYLNDKSLCNDSRHEQIRKHILLATRNFDHRVKAFLKHILMSKENPMNPKFFNYRVEFQARGAGHIHGVIWLDLEKSLPNGVNNLLLKSAFDKFKKEDKLSVEEESNVVNFIDSFITCSTEVEEVKKLLIRKCNSNKDAITEKVVATAKKVNRHSQKHSKSCKKYRSKCRFGFPKYPSTQTLITKPAELVYQEQLDAGFAPKDIEGRGKFLDNKMKENRKLLKLVHEKLEEYDSLNSDDTVLVNMEDSSLEGAINDMLLTDSVKEVVPSGEDVLQRYKEALETSAGNRYSVILKRHPRDRYLNNYNPEWMHAWNGNLDLQPCLDFYSIVTYISDYYSKDDTGTVEVLKNAHKELAHKSVIEQLKGMANTFLTHRKMGELKVCIE